MFIASRLIFHIQEIKTKDLVILLFNEFLKMRQFLEENCLPMISKTHFVFLYSIMFDNIEETIYETSLS